MLIECTKLKSMIIDYLWFLVTQLILCLKCVQCIVILDKIAVKMIGLGASTDDT